MNDTIPIVEEFFLFFTVEKENAKVEPCCLHVIVRSVLAKVRSGKSGFTSTDLI